MRSRTKSPHAKARDKARDYLWHLEPPWVTTFDHTHWWKEPGNALEAQSSEAVLWEIFRRRTAIPKLRQTFDDAWRSGDRDRMLGVILGQTRYFLAAKCERSWLRLNEDSIGWWKWFLGKIPAQRGFYPNSIEVLNSYRRQKLPRILARSAKQIVQTLKCRLAVDAEEHDEKGRIIVSIDPSVAPDRIAASVQVAVKLWQSSQKQSSAGRSHFSKWLDAIAKFEDEELSPNRSKVTRNDQLFAAYRRCIGGWSFTSQCLS